ncbi:MAG TPA: 16S rRNA (cytidine(1402)-2'-O)-methyltransferase [Candidatus Binataceae bacterium]|nr:16S rRNA (cytidine(1402)-2'-O)-methyltransferase [Candidatus Binataceae bacterium]
MKPQSQTVEPGMLFVVSTPIGNPDDISARALKVLGDVDLIACEDTRRTGRLLAAYGLKKPLLSYFEHNEERRTPELIERITRGERIALVTDAGTPSISDPGFRLVRAALSAGIRVTAIPGPTAAIAALSISGLPTNRFAFEGFLPAKAEARRKSLDSLASEPRTMIFFEAARRLAATLGEMASALGSSRNAAVVREVTKTWEETIRGTLGELARRFHENPVLGEITIVIEGAPDSAASAGVRAASITVDSLLEEGLSLKQASAIVSKLTGRSRRQVYQEAVKSRDAREQSGC